MLREISFKQLIELQAYDDLSPIGDKRGDWQAAQICATVMKALQLRVGLPPTFQPADFLLDFDKPVIAAAVPDTPSTPPTEPWQRLKFIAQMHTASANAEEEKKRRR